MCLWPYKKKKLQQKRFVFSRRSYVCRICIDPTVASGWGQVNHILWHGYCNVSPLRRFLSISRCFSYWPVSTQQLPLWQTLASFTFKKRFVMEKLKIAIYSMIQKFRFFPVCYLYSKTFLVSFLKCFSLLSSSTQEILHFGDEVIPFVNPVIVGFELRHSSK